VPRRPAFCTRDEEAVLGARGMVVLVVEDEVLVALVLRLALQAAGHRVLGPAATAGEALRLAAAEPPELALVDLGLPGGPDGAALARALRDRHGTACLFLTAWADRARAARDAAVGLLAKPYDPPLAGRAVEAVAALRRGEPPARLPPYLELFR
jgi:two-component system, response regulator PdtaR